MDYFMNQAFLIPVAPSTPPGAQLKPRLMARSALSGLPLLGVSLAALAGVALTPLPARALPQDGVVAAGAASIAQTGAASMAIHQASMAAVIDWRSFDIGADETVEVFQPSSMASLMNRVVGGGGASQILGTLKAQGRLTLVNPEGITIGDGARIDVAGLIASTANMSDQDFMLGRGDFTIAGRPDARIANAGDISIRDGGLAALVAPGVENSGVIAARLGRVQLAAGDTFTLDLYGDDLIRIGVSDSTLSSILNTGRISADGGVIEITARSGAAAVDGVINVGGVVEARSAGIENGAVVFYGASDGIVNVSGNVDVSGRNADETGGTIKVLGDRVALTRLASLDASGDAGGGTILVGGDFQGKGATPAASRTYVGHDATINTSAINTGNAGKAVVWADGDTRYYGLISARGGAQSGDGGAVEVSGKQNLGFDGRVDTTAPKGASGSLLLDPDFIVIKNGGSGADDAEVSDGSIMFADGGTGTFNISETALEGLTTTDLTLQANNKITIEDLSDNQLTLTQTGQIMFEAGAGGFEMVDANDLIALTGGGSLIIDTTIAAGTIATGRISAGTGAVTIDGGSIILGSGLTTGDAIAAGYINITSSQAVAVNANLNASGSIFVSAESGVNVNASMLALNTILLDGDVSDDSKGSLVFQGGGVTLEARDITLLADSSSTGSTLGTGDIYALGYLTLDAKDGTDGSSTYSVDIGDTLYMGGYGSFSTPILNVNADTNSDGDGQFRLASGQTVFSNGNRVNIYAADLSIDGAIGTGSGSLFITSSFGDVQIGANNAAATMNISGNEMSRITAANFNLDTGNSIIIDGITASDSASITFAYFHAGNDLTFSGGASTFQMLQADAAGDLAVNADLTATYTGLYLMSDYYSSGVGLLSIASGKVVTFAGTGPGGLIDLTGADVDIAGTVLASTGTVTVTNTINDVQVGPSGASPDMDISNAELAAISAGALVIESIGEIYVSGANGSEVQDVLLAAAGDVIFSGDASTFVGDIQISPGEGIVSLNADISAFSFYFSGPVVVSGARTLHGVVDSEFSSTVNAQIESASSLTFILDDGVATFAGTVGGFGALADLSVTAAIIEMLSGATTTGDQTYTGSTDLNGDFTTTGGDFTVSGATTLDGSVGIFATNGAVSMNTVNGYNNLNITAIGSLSLGALGDLEFGDQLDNVTINNPDGAIGSASNPLYVDLIGSLSIDAASADLTGFVEDGLSGVDARAAVIFNDVQNSSDPLLVFDGFSGGVIIEPPSQTFSGLLVNGDVDDYYFSTTGSGLVTINAKETVDDDSDFDSVILLYADDGSPDLANFIAYDDDSGGGPSDLESLLSLTLNTGNYLVRVGTHGFNENGGVGHHTGTDYTLSIVGDFVAGISGPPPPPPPPTSPPPAAGSGIAAAAPAAGRGIAATAAAAGRGIAATTAASG